MHFLVGLNFETMRNMSHFWCPTLEVAEEQTENTHLSLQGGVKNSKFSLTFQCGMIQNSNLFNSKELLFSLECCAKVSLIYISLRASDTLLFFLRTRFPPKSPRMCELNLMNPGLITHDSSASVVRFARWVESLLGSFGFSVEIKIKHYSAAPKISPARQLQWFVTRSEHHDFLISVQNVERISPQVSLEGNG